MDLTFSSLTGGDMVDIDYDKLGATLDEGYHEGTSYSVLSRHQSVCPSVTESPVTLHNKDIPDLDQQSSMLAIAPIIAKYKDYKNGYHHLSYGSNDLDIQLNRGKDFALSILSYYYPEGQGFVIRAKTFEPMSKHGWSIELKAPTNVKESNPYGHWHYIPPEYIAGFEVSKKHIIEHDDGTQDEELRPHTFFAIVADDCQTQPQWLVPTKIGNNFRGDLMAHALGSEARISKGYCFLIIGRFFEFYHFDNHRENPISPFPHSGYPENWSQDMDSTVVPQDTPWVADIWYDMLATSDVLYQDGVVGEGVKRSMVHFGN